MSSEFIYLIIALFLFVNFMNIKSSMQMRMFDGVMQSQEYYNGLALAEKTIDRAWLVPFKDLISTFNNVTTTEIWDGVPFQVKTTVVTYSYRGMNNYRKMDVEVSNSNYNVYVKVENIFADLQQ